MLKAIIFDMDGVLVNSIKYIWDSFSELLKDDGVDFSESYVKANLSRSLRDNRDAWIQEYGIKNFDLDEFSRNAAELQLKHIKMEPPNHSLHKFLEETKKSDIQCAVATSSKRWRAEKILEALDIKKYFDAIVTADDVNNHKPDPEVFLEAARQLNVNPLECIVIEDAGNGIEAAKNASMKAIGLVTKYHTTSELSHADLVINNFSEIDIEIIKKLFE